MKSMHLFTLAIIKTFFVGSAEEMDAVDDMMQEK